MTTQTQTELIRNKAQEYINSLSDMNFNESEKLNLKIAYLVGFTDALLENINK